MHPNSSFTAYQIAFERSAGVTGERMRVVEAMAESLSDVLKGHLPPEWKYVPYTDHDKKGLSLEICVFDQDENRQVFFESHLDFNTKSVHIDNFTIGAGRGSGIGRDFFRAYTELIAQAGFKQATVKTNDIGSYFWLPLGFRPNYEGHLVGQIRDRLCELETWVSRDIMLPVRRALIEAAGNAAHFRDVARLDFRHELKEAFACASFQKQLSALPELPVRTETIPEAYRASAPQGSNRDPRLGHLLLVGTGWEGSMRLV